MALTLALSHGEREPENRIAPLSFLGEGLGVRVFIPLIHRQYC